MRRCIGSYIIISELGQGATSRVYLAKHAYLKNAPRAAIKLISGGNGLSSKKMREQFLMEAHLLEELEHPHVLRIHDAGLHGHIAYLVTEFAPGGSLRSRLNQLNKPFSVQKTIKILAEVGQGLHHAHQKGVVHRDIKPENILFNAQDSAVLADFGISIEEADGTKFGDVVGTASYMAPEQFDGQISKKSDQYALGCIGYELLTGQKAFPGTDYNSKLRKHKTEYPPSIRDINPLVPDFIDRAIFKAINKERIERHPDISAFITKLQEAVQWFEEGNDLSNANRHEEALKAYKTALDLDSCYEYAHKAHGDALHTLRRYPEALEAYEKAIALDRKYAYAYKSKGDSLNAMKRYSEAVAAFDEALALVAFDEALAHDKVRKEAHNNKGLALLCLQHYDEALASFNDALALDPYYQDSLRLRADVLNLLIFV